MAEMKCVSCGLCCHKVGDNITQAKKMIIEGGGNPFIKAIAEFPFEVDADGACVKLENNQCSIYETRPGVCNVKWLWQNFFRQDMTEQKFYDENWKACLNLMDEANYILPS